MSKKNEDCTHTYKTVLVQVPNHQGRIRTETEPIVPKRRVSACSPCKQRKQNLGWPYRTCGAFYDEFKKVAGPPGYSYIGNPQYGEWRRSGGQSFWVFYGQYALMRDLFWGRGNYGRYRVSRRGWSNYRNSMKSGRSYYGSSKQYGTSGRHTRSTYSNSKYFKARAQRSSSSGGGSRRSGGGGDIAAPPMAAEATHDFPDLL